MDEELARKAAARAFIPGDPREMARGTR